MEATTFLQKFTEQFDPTPEQEVTLQTNFKDIDGWSSLTALSIIAMVDEEFGVELKNENIRNSNTVEDLFNIVKNKV